MLYFNQMGWIPKGRWRMQNPAPLPSDHHHVRVTEVLLSVRRQCQALWCRKHKTHHCNLCLCTNEQMRSRSKPNMREQRGLFCSGNGRGKSRSASVFVLCKNIRVLWRWMPFALLAIRTLRLPGAESPPPGTHRHPPRCPDLHSRTVEWVVLGNSSIWSHLFCLF